ncbi:MAG TPA: hypothetical protein VGQ59_08170 [Cyclobacteriaceae bacterium]|nr:hypothetical protein [Cyclobacteriaceae bacterium]
MDKFDYIKEVEAQTVRVNKLLKTLKLGDGSNVELPKTKTDKIPLPRRKFWLGN